MRRVLLAILLGMGWCASVEAEQTVELDRPIDVGELTTEAKRLVPSLRGMSDHQDHGLVSVWKEGGGSFTEEEMARIRHVLSVHDASMAEKRKAQRTQARERGKKKLQAMGLSDDEVSALAP